MDCDDQVGFVKRHHDPHPLAPDPPNVSPLPIAIEIDLLGRLDQPFGVSDRRADLTGPVLRMSREAHIGLSLETTIFAPLWTEDATLSPMEVEIKDLANQTANVLAAVNAGQRVVLTDNGDPLADIVSHDPRARWLSDTEFREQLQARSADPALRQELDELAGQTLDEP